MTIRELQAAAHATAVDRGWYDRDRPPLELLMLMVTELSECAEEWRRPERHNDAVAEELADCVIRIADAADYWGIDLEAAIARKMEINRTRPVRHGGKAF